MNTRLTQREMLNCQDTVSSIISGVQKFNAVAQECNDPELKRVCQDLQAAHQRHYQTIIKHLGGGPQVS
ncbi:MAG: spore coat protein [Firmicutes bacterium]|nr:spore coat protein [Bacillota bacterium]